MSNKQMMGDCETMHVMVTLSTIQYLGIGD